MDTQVFWNVIGQYNSQTWTIQIILLIFMISAMALSYIQTVRWAAKFALGITNLFIGIVFFAWYGTEPIQKFFALPLFLLCGILFLWESQKYKADMLEKPSTLFRLQKEKQDSTCFTDDLGLDWYQINSF